VRGAISIIAASLGACSFIAVPSVRTTGEYRDERVAETCTDTSAAPETDLVVAIVAGLLALNGARHALDDDPPPASDDPGFGELISIGAGILGGVTFPFYAVSARHGFVHVGRCRAELAKPPHP
jgi:hypothetical protein